MKLKLKSNYIEKTIIFDKNKNKNIALLNNKLTESFMRYEAYIA